jgi:hypothetical protein
LSHGPGGQQAYKPDGRAESPRRNNPFPVGEVAAAQSPHMPMRGGVLLR